jgi:DNA-binding protein H-NS
MAAKAIRSQRKQDPEQGVNIGAVPAKVQEALESLTVTELKAVISFSEAKVQEKTDGEREALIEDTRRRAAELGLTVQDLFGDAGKSSGQKRKAGRGEKTGGALPVKYRGPQPGDQWSGRGRKPGWAKELNREQLEKYRVQAD